jgi:hypothetical protein
MDRDILAELERRRRLTKAFGRTTRGTFSQRFPKGFRQSIKERVLRGATVKNNPAPSGELLDKVRGIAAFQEATSPEIAKSLKDKGMLPYFREQLRSLLNELDIQVSVQTRWGLFGKWKVNVLGRLDQKIVHRVAEKDVVRLEFTYLIRGTLGSPDKGSATLESVSRYQAGDWEQKIDMAYMKCLDLRSQWDEIYYLTKRITMADHRLDELGEIVKLIETTKDPVQTTKLLALRDPETLEPLYGFCLFVGKLKEALLAIQTLVERYPEKAIYHLSLANYFYLPLHNSVKGKRPLLAYVSWASTKEYESPGDEAWAKRITLEAVGCSYEAARDIAEREFMAAMRLAPDNKLKEQAENALLALRGVEQLYGSEVAGNPTEYTSTLTPLDANVNEIKSCKRCRYGPNYINCSMGRTGKPASLESLEVNPFRPNPTRAYLLNPNQMPCFEPRDEVESDK